MARSTTAPAKVRIQIHGNDNYQLDSDVDGESTTLAAEIKPGALSVCIPAPKYRRRSARDEAVVNGAQTRRRRMSWFRSCSTGVCLAG